MRIHFDNVGAVGVIKDTPSHELSQAAWSDGANISFGDGKVFKSKGYQQQFESSTASPSIAVTPYSLLFHQVGGNDFWAYAGLNKIYATDGTTHADLTNAGGDYSAVATIPWTGGNLGGIAIMNNGINVPQQWGDTATAASLTKAFKDLENWSSTTTARFVRPFKEFLIAGDITKDSTRNERELRWSHPAEPGTVPDSWDYNDATKDAGKFEMAQSSDALIDSLPLRDINILYKEYSAWGMQFIGAPNIFRIYNVFENIGLLAPRCAANFFGRHFIFGNDDVIIHDGQNHERPFHRKWVKYLFNQLDPDHYAKSFVVPNYNHNEIWLCFPESGNTWPNKAIVWNYQENHTTVRELPGATHIAFGVGGPGNDTWASDSGTYNVDNTSWDQKIYNPTVRRLLMATPGSTDRIHLLEETEQANGNNLTSYVERQALPLGRQAGDGSIKFDYTTYKFIRNIYPNIDGTDGGVVNIYLGTQDTLDGKTTWNGPYEYTIGSSYKIDCRVSGRIISIKYESTTNITWSLNSYAVDFELEGER